MADNSVRVTLTADDQATEIVRRLSAAVKQLDGQQRSANKNTADASTHAKSAASSFESFGRAIASVAAALGAIRVVEFVRNTIEATDQIGKLALKTGATTEALSVLAVAASTADLSQEELGNGLKFLSRAQSELQAGIPQTVAAFQALGLSAAQLKGLSLDQVLVKIANAQDKFADGAGKAAALMKIFGRNGTELIPLLHDLAGGGFDAARKKAEELGIVLSKDDTRAAQDFDDALTTLKNSFKGVVVSITPFIKGLADIVNGIASLVAKHQGVVVFAGAVIGLAGAIGTLSLAIAALGAQSTKAAIAFLFTPMGAVVASFLAVAAAVGFVVLKLREAASAKKALEAPLANDPALDKALGLDKPKPDVKLTDPSQRKAAIEAELAATKAGLAQELEATKASLAFSREIEDEAFAQGLTGLKAYYTARLSLTEQATRAELARLNQEKAALQAAPLPENTQAERTKREQEIAGIVAQRARVELDGKRDVLALTEQQRIAEKQLAIELQGFAEQRLRAQGNIVQSEVEQNSAAAERFREALLKNAGEVGAISAKTREDIAAQVAAFEDLLNSRSVFAENQRQSERTLAGLDLERAAIQQKAAQGIISERDGQLQIAAIERARIPALEQAATAMEFFAQKTKDPALLAAAQQLRAQIAGMGVVTDETTVKIANLKDTLLQAAQSDLSQFLGSTISQVNSLKEAFVALATSIVGSFQRVLGDIIASAAVSKIRGLFEGPVAAATSATGIAGATETTAAATALGTAGATVLGGATALGTAAGVLGTAGATVVGGATALGFSATALDASGTILLSAAAALTAAASALTVANATSVLGFASGGYVRGPGSATSDSIPARLSAGEYVIRAAAVRHVGVDFLNALNGLRMPALRRPTLGGLPAFATGGLVTAGESGGSISGGVDLTIGVDESSVIKAVIAAITTRGGIRALRKAIGANPNAFKTELGLA